MIDTSGLALLGEASPADAAAEYGRRGFRVVPLHNLEAGGACSCGRADCDKSAGKHPRIKGWQKEASSDADTIGVWWLDWPRANVGLAMGGRARLVALDVDGAGGRESLARLEAVHGALPRTLTSRSGRADGGEHRLFVVPADLDLSAIKNRSSKIAPGLDVRADGGQIVVSPSIHKSGRPYTWIDDSPIAPLPRWLFDLAAPADPPAPPPPPAPSISPTARGADAVTRASAYLARMPEAISGSGGHQATWNAAVALVRGFALSPGDALVLLLREYNPRCQPPWSRKDLEHKVENAARAQLPSGYLLEDDRRAWQPERAPRRASPTEASEVERDEAPSEEEPPPPLDPAIAPLLERLAAVGGPDDTRPEEDVLADQAAIAEDLVRFVGGKRAEARAEGLASEIARLRELALDARHGLAVVPRLLDAITKRQKALGLDRPQLPDPAASALALLGEPPIGHAPAGLETLDAITDGGFHSGKFHVIAGEPNVGKTSLAVQLALCAVEDGWIVGFHVADVDDRSGIMLRIAQAHGLDRRAFLSRDPETLQETARILSRWRPRFAIVDEAADGRTIDDTAEALLALAARIGGRAALFVDSLQTIALRWVTEPRTDKERIDKVVKRLVEWTRKGLTVIATCEIPRGFYTGPKKTKGSRQAPPALAAFKGSGNIEYAAWTALVITRIRGEKEAVRVEVPKNKQGREDVTFKLERTASRVGYEDAGEMHEHGDDEAPAQGQKKTDDLTRYLERVRKTLAGMPNGFNGNRDELAKLAGGKTGLTRAAIALLITKGELLQERPEGQPARLRLRRSSDGPSTPAETRQVPPRRDGEPCPVCGVASCPPCPDCKGCRLTDPADGGCRC